MNLNRATQYFTKSILIIMLSACGGREIEEPAKIDNPEKAEEPTKTEEPAQEYITLGNGENLINEFGGFYQKIPHLSDINGNAVALVLGADGEIKDKPVSVLSTGEIERPQFFLNQSNKLVNPSSLQPFTTIGSSSPLTLLKDEEGQALIGEAGGFTIQQINHLGELEENEIFVNTKTGKLWKDNNGNLITKKRIDSQPYKESFPKIEENSTLNLGFRKTKISHSDVLFSASYGTYTAPWFVNGVIHYDVRPSTITAATKDGGLIVFGGKEEHYLGSELAKSYDPSTETLVQSSSTKGILKIQNNCNFNEELLSSRYQTPPSKNELISTHDLGCYPKNLRQFASIKDYGIVGLLTKTNELWGIGGADSSSYGASLGGKISNNLSNHQTHSKIALPIKIADNIKMTTLHQGGGELGNFGHALTNDGKVFRIHAQHHATDSQGEPISASSENAKNNGFQSIKVPSNDYIINLFTSSTGPRVLALGVSGDYYFLGEDHLTANIGNEGEPLLLELNPKPKDFFSMNVVNRSSFPMAQYIGIDGKLYGYIDRRPSWSRSDWSQGVNPIYPYYIDSINYRTENLPFKKSTRDINFNEVIGGGYNVLLKDNQGNYYTKLYPDYNGIFLGSTIDHGDYLNNHVLVKLGEEVPAIAFLKNNPNYEFLYNDFRVLVNNKDKKIAIIDTGEYSLSLNIGIGGGVEFYTETARSGERTVYGSVNIMPDEISEQLFLAD